MKLLKNAIENFDLPKNYQPDILVWKLIKRYYNQKCWSWYGSCT